MAKLQFSIKLMSTKHEVLHLMIVTYLTLRPNYNW